MIRVADAKVLRLVFVNLDLQFPVSYLAFSFPSGEQGLFFYMLLFCGRRLGVFGGMAGGNRRQDYYFFSCFLAASMVYVCLFSLNLD